MEFRVDVEDEYVYIGIAPMIDPIDVDILAIAQLLIEIKKTGKIARFTVPPRVVIPFLTEMGFVPLKDGFTWEA